VPNLFLIDHFNQNERRKEAEDKENGRGVLILDHSNPCERREKKQKEKSAENICGRVGI